MVQSDTKTDVLAFRSIRHFGLLPAIRCTLNECPVLDYCPKKQPFFESQHWKNLNV